MNDNDRLDALWSWLIKLQAFGTIDKDLYDWTMGKANGYSKCCIKNFINLCKLHLLAGLWMETHFGNDYSFVEHVRFPLCRKNGSIKPESIDGVRNGNIIKYSYSYGLLE